LLSLWTSALSSFNHQTLLSIIESNIYKTYHCPTGTGFLQPLANCNSIKVINLDIHFLIDSCPVDKVLTVFLAATKARHECPQKNMPTGKASSMKALQLPPMRKPTNV